MKQVAQRATMLTCEPLYKARKNGNINFSDAKGQLALWSMVGSG